MRVAVIDSGIDYTHPDLAGQYGGGWDFLNGDSDPFDDHGHGTHVAGTIAAAMNNPTGGAEEGVAGVAPSARILSYKVCGPDGSCTDFGIAQALDRAITDHAQVINMSLGGAEYSQAMYDGVQAAWEAGLVIVAAAGNAGVTDPFYPAAFPNVISVAAFDEDHRRASFSNYGSWVDLSAPGNVIMSSYLMSACAPSTVPGNTGCYAWNSGTSMAAPHVSGAAALVWSRSDVTSNSQVADIILNSADPVGVSATRLDSWTIHGGLNLHNAMSYGASEPNLPPVADAGPDQTVSDTDANGTELVTLNGSGSTDPEGRALIFSWTEGGTTIGTGQTTQFAFPVGVHVVTLTVTDDAGASHTDTVSITVNPNRAPVASNISVNAFVNTAVNVTRSATDAEQCELTFSVSGPTGGTLGGFSDQPCVAGTPNRDTMRVTYSPNQTPGTYTFTYVARDGHAQSNTATVTVTVKRKGRK